MIKILLIITLIFVITGFECQAQNIENFMRPYADKIVENAAFEFSDKNTNEKFSSIKNFPIKSSLEIESEYLHWSYTSALAYDGLFELGKIINEESDIDFTKNAFAFFFDNKSYMEVIVTFPPE